MKKIKWGVIGTAGIARSCTIPGMIQAYNCELYAIAGRSIDKAEQFKEKFGFEKAYGSYKELLDDPEVEAVYCYIDSAFITSDYNKENIRMRRETLGGCTYDLGVYNTSLTLGLLNEEPEKVEASAIFSEEKIDKLTSVVMEFADGKKAAFTCGMTLATNQDRRLDCLEIDGTKGSITGTKFAFNGEGELSYTIRTAEGQEEVKTVEVPQNYRLEVEQFGRCIDENEIPAVTEEFSLKNARLVERILEEIGY